MPNWTKADYDAFLKRHQQGASNKPVSELTQKRIAVIRGKGNQGGNRMNKTEAEYLSMLEIKKSAGKYTIVRYNQLKFRVAGLKCHYTPDFSCVRPDGKIEIHEVKGEWVYEDARVKFKTCVDKYPEFIWIWAQKLKTGWRINVAESALQT